MCQYQKHNIRLTNLLRLILMELCVCCVSFETLLYVTTQSGNISCLLAFQRVNVSSYYVYKFIHYVSHTIFGLIFDC